MVVEATPHRLANRLRVCGIVFLSLDIGLPNHIRIRGAPVFDKQKTPARLKHTSPERSGPGISSTTGSLAMPMSTRRRVSID
jgi:hypothetical protein